MFQRFKECFVDKIPKKINVDLNYVDFIAQLVYCKILINTIVNL